MNDEHDLGLQFRCGPFMLSNMVGCESSGCGTIGKVFKAIEDNKTDIGENLTDISTKFNSKYIITSIFKTVTKY